MTNIALILIAALAVNTCGFTYNTRGMQGNNDSHAEKIKAEIHKRGIGEKSPVKVKLQDNADEVKGYISRIDETSFQVTDRKSGRVTSINYADVNKVRGSGLSTAAKIAIAAGIAVGILVAITLGSIAADCRIPCRITRVSS